MCRNFLPYIAGAFLFEYMTGTCKLQWQKTSMIVIVGRRVAVYAATIRTWIRVAVLHGTGRTRSCHAELKTMHKMGGFTTIKTSLPSSEQIARMSALRLATTNSFRVAQRPVSQQALVLAASRAPTRTNEGARRTFLTVIDQGKEGWRLRFSLVYFDSCLNIWLILPLQFWEEPDSPATRFAPEHPVVSRSTKR